MVNDCRPEQSIIKDYSKLTDNQLEVNVLKGHEQAIVEKKRRQNRLSQSEARCLLDAWVNESQRRYSKVNKEALLYRKLSRIIGRRQNEKYNCREVLSDL